MTHTLSGRPPNMRHKRHDRHGAWSQASHPSPSVTENAIKSMAVTLVTLVTNIPDPSRKGTTSVTPTVTQVSRLLVPMPLFLSGGRGVGGGYAFALCVYCSSFCNAPFSLSSRPEYIPCKVSNAPAEIVKYCSFTAVAMSVNDRSISSMVNSASMATWASCPSNKAISGIISVVTTRLILGTISDWSASGRIPSIPFSYILLKNLSSSMAAFFAESFTLLIRSSSTPRARLAFCHSVAITPKKPSVPTIAVWKSLKKLYQPMLGGLA